MHLFHFYHSHRMHRLANTDFWLFESSVWLHTIARSLISIFIPILMVQSGFSVLEVVWYYVLYNAFDVPLNFVARSLIRYIGARKVIVIATISTIAFFISLSFLETGGWALLALAALLAALYDSFYWVAHIFLFIEANHNAKESARNTSLLYVARKMGGMLGPAVGAIVLIFATKVALIGASVAIFALSILPLIEAKNLPDKPKEKSLSFKEFFSTSEERRNYFSSALYAIHGSAEGVLLPLFIFVLLESVESVAAVPIIISITAIIFSYFAGKIAPGDREKMIALGAGLIAILWAARLAISTPIFYYISIFLVGIFSLLVSIPLDTKVFSRGRERDPLGASAYRNSAHMFAKLIFYLILAVLVGVFKVGFITAALALFALVVLNYFIIASRGKGKQVQAVPLGDPAK